jgi:hypothetical protein
MSYVHISQKLGKFFDRSLRVGWLGSCGGSGSGVRRSSSSISSSSSSNSSSSFNKNNKLLD